MTKVACVVGAAGGIGSAVCRRLDNEGFSLLRMDLGGPLAIDLAAPVSVEAAFSAARRQAPQLDVLVVAAGILDLGKLADLTLEQWHRVLAVNLTGPFLCC